MKLGAHGDMRGHKIIFDEDVGEWVYEDDYSIADYDRPCTRCGMMPTKDGHDACIPNLPGVINACCGHGDVSDAYVMLRNGETIRGEAATKWMRDNKPLSQERWLPVVDYEGLYEVSNLGRVRRAKNGPKTYRGKILAPGTDKGGYQYVALHKCGKQRTDRVHRLVMASFAGVCPDRLQVNHKNGDKANNRLENLEYVTPSENVKHAFTSGLRSDIGESHPHSKLTEEDVYEIRMLIGKETQESIGRRFNVEQSCISKIASRKGWRHLPEELDALTDGVSDE